MGFLVRICLFTFIQKPELQRVGERVFHLTVHSSNGNSGQSQSKTRRPRASSQVFHTDAASQGPEPSSIASPVRKQSWIRSRAAGLELHSYGMLALQTEASPILLPSPSFHFLFFFSFREIQRWGEKGGAEEEKKKRIKMMEIRLGIV